MVRSRFLHFALMSVILRPLVLLHMGLPKEGLHPSGQINSVLPQHFLNSLNYHFCRVNGFKYMNACFNQSFCPPPFLFGFYDSSNLIIRYIISVGTTFYTDDILFKRVYKISLAVPACHYCFWRISTLCIQ